MKEENKHSYYLPQLRLSDRQIDTQITNNKNSDKINLINSSDKRFNITYT